MRSFKKAFNQHNRVKTIVFALVFVLFVLYALGLLYPFFYALVIALKKNGRAFMNEPVKVTFPLYFSNFIEAFGSLKLENATFWDMTFNSLWYAAGSTLCLIIASTCVAYVTAKYKFPGRSLIHAVAIFTMMIPIYGALPAQYRLYTKLGMIDSPLYLIATFSGFGMYFIYIYSFFKNLSWSYAEAAFIDGAGNFRAFISIMVPMLLPSITALSVMNFVTVWNDYMNPILFFYNMPTLASGLYEFEQISRYTANQPIYFAGALISLIPVLTIFVIFQNTIMSNVYTGGLKG